MNSWPEAAWIVRKMRKYFNLDARVNQCKNELNDIRDDTEEFNTSILELNNTLNELEPYLGEDSPIQEALDSLIQIEEQLNELKERINNIQNTPAIFDTDQPQDGQDPDNIPDTHEEDSFVNNSIWFVE